MRLSEIKHARELEEARKRGDHLSPAQPSLFPDDPPPSPPPAQPLLPLPLPYAEKPYSPTSPPPLRHQLAAVAACALAGTFALAVAFIATLAGL